MAIYYLTLLRLVRFPNLLIILITQYLLRYGILEPAFQRTQISPQFDTIDFALLAFSTALLAAAGYIINDIIDYPIDQINKPQKVSIGRGISISTAWRWYYLLNMLTLVISVYLAWQTGLFILVIFFIAGAIGLYLYSRYWKCQPIIGNFLIALFCACVALLVVFAEMTAWHTLFQINPILAQRVGGLFLAYGAFALLSTLFREVVKDIEDIQGDQQFDCRTFSVVFGLAKSKWLAASFGIILWIGLIGLVYWQFHNLAWQRLGLIYTIVGIILPLTYAIWLLYKASTTKSFGRLSLWIKVIMLMGLLYLPLFGFLLINYT